MSQLPQLQALQLHNNGLSGGLPPMPEAMRNLNLEYNRIRYELQSILIRFDSIGHKLYATCNLNLECSRIRRNFPTDPSSSN